MEIRKRKWDQADQQASSAIAPQFYPEDEPEYENSNNGTEESTPEVVTVRSVEEAKKMALLKAQELSAAVAASLQEESEGRADTPQGNTFETFTEDIDINDCKNRYLLTKSQTQHEIKEAFSVDITTRGKYFPDRSKASSSEPALHLHVSSSSKEALDNAVAKIYELMDKQVEPVTQEKTSYNPRVQPPPRQILTDKVYVGWEADRFFNIRAKIVGPGGAYVKHIQQQSNVRLQLKGKGSGYMESATGRESDEPLHVWLTTTQDEEALEKAKTLLQDLLSKVKTDYDQWKANRGSNTASIGYSASHAHAQERVRFSERSHFQAQPPPVPVIPPVQPPPVHVPGSSSMFPPAPPAPTPPPTIVSTPEQYAIYHQYYQQYYQHYYQQYVMMSSMHFPQQHQMHSYMQPPTFSGTTPSAPPPSLPSSASAANSAPPFPHPSTANPTSATSPPLQNSYAYPNSSHSSSHPSSSASFQPEAHSSSPNSNEQTSQREGTTEAETNSTSDPAYSAYAAYYSQYYQQEAAASAAIAASSQEKLKSTDADKDKVSRETTNDFVSEESTEHEAKRPRIE